MSKGLSYFILAVIVVLAVVAFYLHQFKENNVPPADEPALQSPDDSTKPTSEGRIEEKLGFTGEGL